MNDKDNKLFVESTVLPERVRIGPFDTLEEALEYKDLLAWPAEWVVKDLVGPLQNMLDKARERIDARKKAVGTVCRCVMCIYHREKQ